MKLLHRMFSRLGLSLGGHQACLKYGCKDYCGYSPSEAMMFASDRWLANEFANKDRDRKATHKPLLLTIEVEDMESIPTVKYHGKELEGRISISYEWGTGGAYDRGNHEIHIKHFDKEENSVRTIGMERLTIPPTFRI